MRSNRLAVLGLLLGSILGYSLSGPSDASRNASGTYSLPTGNPVVAHTTATSTWANTTMSDLANEVTNSVDRNGRGCMLASFQLASGTSSAPGLNFCSETNSGIYRAAAGDIRMQVGAANVEKWTATGVTDPLGLTATQSQSNASAITATGNGTARGVNATGGATSGTGVEGTGGATNGIGVKGTGAGSGAGVSGTGASGGTGVGGAFTGGSSGAIGVTGTGTSTSAGGSFANGTAATGGTRQDAVALTNGDLNLSGVTNPTSTTSLTNRLTPANVVKAYAKITTTNATPFVPSVDSGFNVASVSRTNATTLRMTFGGAMASANYVVLGTNSSWFGFVISSARATGTVDVQLLDAAGAARTLDSPAVGTALTWDLFVIGLQ